MKQRKCALGRNIHPRKISDQMSIQEIVDENFLAFNAARLREACWLLTRKMLEPDVTVGLAIAGALTPAGLGISCIIPLIEHGFVDWIISTGANIYHDIHYAIGLHLYSGSPFHDDRKLKKEKIVRIYDVLLDYNVLLSTDDFLRKILDAEEFQAEMSTAEFHHRLGRYISEQERILSLGRVSIIAAAYKAGVPIYTSAPGDSSIGMNVARATLEGMGPRIDTARDVNETAAIVLDAKKKGKSAAWILGGGSPKNFLLQTEPYLQEILGKEVEGHDYFLQITDARADTGGLSGATPSEAVSWGKVDPQHLPDAVVCYADVTIALPILTAYGLARHPARNHSRLFEKREELVQNLTRE